MRKIFICLLVSVAVIAAAQTPYAFRIEYDEVHVERGELYQYSEHYLGTKDVITETGISFVLCNIELVTQEQSTAKNNKRHNERDDDDADVSALPPYNEESLMAANTAKKAESVAKQIYRIREARLALVSGEADHLPQDGSSMKQALAELQRMEKQLTELFVGKRTIVHHKKIIRYTADTTVNTINDVLLRFSKFSGPVATDDMSGAPVKIKMTLQKEPAADADKKKKKDAPVPMRIKSTQVQVIYENKTFINTTLL